MLKKYFQRIKDRDEGTIALTVAFILYIFVAYDSIFVPTKRDNLYYHGQCTSGYVQRSYRGYNHRTPNVTVDYIYYVNGTQYHNSSSSISLRYKAINGYLNKWLPVIYNSENPAESQMLITPRDFENFQREVPDTLLWIYHFVE